MKVSSIFSFDIIGQLLFYFIKVLYAQSDHDCSSQNSSSYKITGAGDVARIVMYMADNGSFTMTMCRGPRVW